MECKKDGDNLEKWNATYWNDRWQDGATGWDIGYASPAITEYMAQYPDREAKILIPGCGSAYEAEYLLAAGYQDITLIDIAADPVERLQRKFSGKPEVKIVQGDFFEHEQLYDLVLEQTFFCALPPGKRPDYVRKMAALLRPGGRLVGVLFRVFFEKEGPPFGGSSEEYRSLFSPFFEEKVLAECYNSIGPRRGSELFVHWVKKPIAITKMIEE